ncbi:hypothetical protein QTN47_27350 [Danxiaibacter flavus]|uniref:Uncharacterized protein n=1 Tax=Danxiaibacter flavus TaxID=3049108 RepID=A0ABV3ZMZ8_9BACT|nr:hypothetical protein QNM32_27350 [Chitinophagaceae bacterium DXS]
MKLVPKFSKADIQKFLEDKMKALDTATLTRLKRIGETFVKNARENGNYTDMTGNLRNSIGYVILRDGEQLFQNFKKAARVKSDTTGANTAQRVALEVAASFPRGYVLIVVAGMDYAAAVESRGKDVITASSITAKNDLSKAVDAIKRSLARS